MARKGRKNVGVIGLGIIGSRAAAGLRQAGFTVFVWNRTPKAAPNFLGSPVEIAKASEIIQLFVADSHALFQVIDAISPALTAEHLVICSATVGPEATLEAAKLVQDRGAQFLDAPFTGSKVAAERRELVYYVGGDDAAILRAEPVLEATSKAIVRIGAIGHAATIKVVTNMIAAVSIQTLAEALALVKKAGLPAETLTAALEHNACRSGTMELKLPKMIQGDYEPHFSLKHMFKDVQLGIHMANALSLEIPTTTVTAGVMYGALNRGWADLDFAAIYKRYEPADAPVSSAKVRYDDDLEDEEQTASASGETTEPQARANEGAEPAVETSPINVPRAVETAQSEVHPMRTSASENLSATSDGEPEALIVESTVVRGDEPAEVAMRPMNFVRRWFVSRNGG